MEAARVVGLGRAEGRRLRGGLEAGVVVHRSLGAAAEARGLGPSEVGSQGGLVALGEAAAGSARNRLGRLAEAGLPADERREARRVCRVGAEGAGGYRVSGAEVVAACHPLPARQAAVEGPREPVGAWAEAPVVGPDPEAVRALRRLRPGRPGARGTGYASHSCAVARIASSPR